MLFKKKLPPLNFDSILIISYGRSGSTLLQGVLNSIDGVLIRGENMNMCFHMFKTYQAIITSKSKSENSAQSPFFGAKKLDDSYFLKQTEETVKNLLLADYRGDTSIRCYGFKEIRYESNLGKLPEFLEFLKLIFPKSCFIFNTRNREDVVRSWINLNWKTEAQRDESFNQLEKMETIFFDYLDANKENSFHITYEDVIAKSEHFKAMFSFLGAQYKPKEIEAVLNLKHSYKPFQKHVAKMPNDPKKKKWF